MSAVAAVTSPAPAALPRAFWALWVCQLVNRLGSFVQPFLVLYLTQDRHLSAGTAMVARRPAPTARDNAAGPADYGR